MFDKLKNMLGLGEILEERPVELMGMTLNVQLRELGGVRQISFARSSLGARSIHVIDNEYIDEMIEALERLRGEAM